MRFQTTEEDRGHRLQNRLGDRGKVNRIIPSGCTSECLKMATDGYLQCSCGEDRTEFDWTWKNKYWGNVEFYKNNKEVIFHSVFSTGTSVVRGAKPFEPNCHYYWEIKILSKLYGTDTAIGVGTSKLDIQSTLYTFTRLLGQNLESWGYSYRGNIQHGESQRSYGTSFGVGNIIGVHLDTWKGTLEYFIDRRSLGIAFTNVVGKDLYPMVSSTAGKIGVRLTCSIRVKPSLQLLCIKLIFKNPALYAEYRKVPGLRKLYDSELFWMRPRKPCKMN